MHDIQFKCSEVQEICSRLTDRTQTKQQIIQFLPNKSKKIINFSKIKMNPQKFWCIIQFYIQTISYFRTRNQQNLKTNSSQFFLIVVGGLQGVQLEASKAQYSYPKCFLNFTYCTQSECIDMQFMFETKNKKYFIAFFILKIVQSVSKSAANAIRKIEVFKMHFEIINFSLTYTCKLFMLQNVQTFHTGLPKILVNSKFVQYSYY
eukprot:TRINITY_DN7171_c0_g1_i11.p2 TRINITY_DN7171_c0_g1~~TRINITY_DN7171_c0_g1_i11.p2  ORF type:complete len:205 (+),score=-10.28 TRINITY_DN7171_c0_g1_i11:1043-1657(+)